MRRIIPALAIVVLAFVPAAAIYALVDLTDRWDREEANAWEQAARERGDAKALVRYAVQLDVGADWSMVREKLACDIFPPGREVAQVANDLRNLGGVGVMGAGVYRLTDQSLWYNLRSSRPAARTQVLEARIRVEGAPVVEKVWLEWRAISGFGNDEHLREPFECARTGKEP